MSNIDRALSHICAAETLAVGLMQVRFAMGLVERSMSDEAARLNVTVQCISKGAWDYIDKHNLPIPRCMESEESRNSHRKARNQQITQ